MFKFLGILALEWESSCIKLHLTSMKPIRGSSKLEILSFSALICLKLSKNSFIQVLNQKGNQKFCYFVV